MSYTDSPIEQIFLRISEKIGNKLREIKTEPNNITTVGLLATLLGIYCLFEGSIFLCILFSLIGQFCDTLDGYYAKKDNMETTLGHYYDHISDGIKLLGILYAIHLRFSYKISDIHVNLLLLICFFSNINLAIKIRLKNLSNEKYDKCLEPWNIFGSLLGNRNNLIQISLISRFFDETSILLYILFFIYYIS